MRTYEQTYEFGGYHRSKIGDKTTDGIALRAGQRYAVVTTQQCLDDGLYYQGVAVNGRIKPSESEVQKYYEDVMVATNQKYYDSLYPFILNQYLAKIDPETGQPYTKDKVEPLVEAAIYKVLSEGSLADTIQKEVDAAVDVYENAYFTSVVNEGESFTSVASDKKADGDTSGEKEINSSVSAANAGAQTTLATAQDVTQTTAQVDSNTVWADWKTDVKDVVERANENKIIADNAPIKVFAELVNWASVDELTKLDEAIARARTALENAKISEDGSDVSSTDIWMTQAQYDELSTALAAAEAQMKLAGTNYKTTLLATTPISDVINAATETLNFTIQAGTSAIFSPETVSMDAKTFAHSAQSVMLAKTGDASILGALAFVCFAFVACITSAIAYKKLKGEGAHAYTSNRLLFVPRRSRCSNVFARVNRRFTRSKK